MVDKIIVPPVAEQPKAEEAWMDIQVQKQSSEVKTVNVSARQLVTNNENRRKQIAKIKAAIDAATAGS